MACSTDITYFQLANNLRDSIVLWGLHISLGNMANKFDDMHKDVKRVVNVAEDILEYMQKSEQSATFITSKRLQMPPKPKVFHGQDSFVKQVAKFFLQEETSRVCILGPGGMGKTSVSLAIVKSSLLQQQFPSHNCIWVPCIEATSAAHLLSKSCAFNCRCLKIVK